MTALATKSKFVGAIIQANTATTGAVNLSVSGAEGGSSSMPTMLWGDESANVLMALQRGMNGLAHKSYPRSPMMEGRLFNEITSFAQSFLHPWHFAKEA